ncbi:MAG: hypothetical protein GWN87_32010 [Desulfuromonadales bacterium]|nr:hypothetical protein [Desulfuromonadales bacterium]
MFPALRSLCIFLIATAMLLALVACNDGSVGHGEDEGIQPNTTPLALASPVRIDTQSETVLVASDAYREAVHVVDTASLEVRQSIRIAGEPCGVAAFGEGVLVGNLATQAVEFYPLSGAEHTTFAAGIGRPASIAVDAAGDRVFVLDGVAEVVRVFDADGVHLRDVPASGEITLTRPSALMFDASAQELYVSDFGDPGNSIAASVKVYSVDGIFLRAISGEGQNVGGWFNPEYVDGFSRPQGVAVVEGTLYVADSLLGQLVAFDAVSGSYIASLGTFGEGPGELYLPLDVEPDGSGNLVVSSNGNASLVTLSTGGAP